MLVVSVDLYNPAWNSVNDDILPDITETHDIGSTTKKFKDVYFSGTLNGDGSNLDDGANGKLTSGTDANELVRLDGSAKLPAVDGSKLTGLEQANIFVVSASDTVRTSTSGGHVPRDSATAKSHEILLNDVSGTIRVVFTIGLSGYNSQTVYGRIYKNGVAYGTQRSSTSNTSEGGTTFTEDLSFTQGDLIQLYTSISGNNNSGVIMGFSLRYDKVVIPATNTINL